MCNTQGQFLTTGVVRISLAHGLVVSAKNCHERTKATEGEGKKGSKRSEHEGYFKTDRGHRSSSGRAAKMQ